MLLAYFPYFTYAIPAFAGALFFVINIEAGRKWAVFSYIASAVIVLISCEKESAMLFVGFFGYYPVLKGIFEEYLKPTLSWLVKLVLFNIAAVISYLIIVFVFGIPFFEGELTASVFLGIMLFLGNIVFVIYDLGLTRIISYYIAVLHPRVNKLFK